MSGCCRRELVRLPDGNARVGRSAQGDRLLVDDAAIELGVVGRRHVGRGHVGIEQRGKELGGRLAGLALPQAVARLRAAGVGEGLGGFGMRGGDRGERGLGRRPEQFFERPQHQLQRLHELGRSLPVVALEPAHAAWPALALAQIGLGTLQRRGDIFELLAKVGRTEGGKLECAQAACVFLRRQAQAAQRMLEQRDERHRLEAPGGGLYDQVKEGADGRGGERRVAGVVGRHAPGLEPHGNPPRQRAVGGDERRRAPGRLRHLAQDEGDGLRLVLGARRLQDGDAVERPGHLAFVGIGNEAVPALGGPGGTHGLADERGTRTRYGRRRAAG